MEIYWNNTTYHALMARKKLWQKKYHNIFKSFYRNIVSEDVVCIDSRSEENYWVNSVFNKLILKNVMF